MPRLIDPRCPAETGFRSSRGAGYARCVLSINDRREWALQYRMTSYRYAGCGLRLVWKRRAVR